MDVMMISDNYAVAPQISAEDVASFAAADFTTIICNRPDCEEPNQPLAADIKTACDAAGISFHHIPVSVMPIPPEDVAAHRQAFDASEGLVLAYCRSGQRSTIIFEASA
ncbi:MAG: TIGR01244 family phosphatase [Gammaproteobacteria bacterium]|nr:TIGR01244 family phosphatase [Gammaproteobacteria bacterium]